jgi:hypothetical protein
MGFPDAVVLVAEFQLLCWKVLPLQEHLQNLEAQQQRWHLRSMEASIKLHCFVHSVDGARAQLSAAATPDEKPLSEH